MARTTKATKSTSRSTSSEKVLVPQQKKGKFQYCKSAPKRPRELGREVHAGRLRLINTFDDKWVNGTTLHYYFFDRESDGEYVVLANGNRQWRSYVGDPDQREVVRDGFAKWAELDIGIKFEEVGDRDDAEIRIGFMRGDGAWSYLGRQILDYGPNERTMNFGWDLTRPGEIDTAIHEIGHTLGFPHEHQNPFAGLVWDDDKVYQALAGPPNYWDQDTTWWNIIRKIPASIVQGTEWDPDSIMHYPFEPGMIKEPPQYRNGLFPAAGLSDRDQTWVKSLYPSLDPRHDRELKVLVPEFLNIEPGGQVNLTLEPAATRKYDIQTFGLSDTVIVLFEDVDGELRYVTGDDDSGTSYNAHLRIKLFRGRRYVLRVRLYWAEDSGRTAVMMW